jgi:hypothetical protein
MALGLMDGSRSVRLSEKSWLKVLFAYLLEKKNFAE